MWKSWFCFSFCSEALRMPWLHHLWALFSFLMVSSGLGGSEVRCSMVLSTLRMARPGLAPTYVSCGLSNPHTTNPWLSREICLSVASESPENMLTCSFLATGLQNQNLRSEARGSWVVIVVLIKGKHVVNVHDHYVPENPFTLYLPSPYLLFSKVLLSKTGQNSHIRVTSKTTGSNDKIGIREMHKEDLFNLTDSQIYLICNYLIYAMKADAKSDIRRPS